jgi:hypothetical protein
MMWISVEHARLTDCAVETHLQIGELPIADSGRYDQLRMEVTDHA